MQFRNVSSRNSRISWLSDCKVFGPDLGQSKVLFEMDGRISNRLEGYKIFNFDRYFVTNSWLNKISTKRMCQWFHLMIKICRYLKKASLYIWCFWLHQIFVFDDKSGSCEIRSTEHIWFLYVICILSINNKCIGPTLKNLTFRRVRNHPPIISFEYLYEKVLNFRLIQEQRLYK